MIADEISTPRSAPIFKQIPPTVRPGLRPGRVTLRAAHCVGSLGRHGRHSRVPTAGWLADLRVELVGATIEHLSAVMPNADPKTKTGITRR